MKKKKAKPKVKKRTKLGLGLFLLKRLQRPRVSARKKSTQKKLKRKSSPRRLSLFQIQEQIPEVKKRKYSKKKEEALPNQLPLPLQESKAVVQETKEIVPQAVTVEVVPPPPLEWGGSLSTLDLVRPSDSLKQSIEAFLLDQRSPHTRKAYGKDLKRFVKFLHARKEDQGIENLGRSVLIAYKESLLTEGLEHTSVDRHLATLRSFFKWLVDDGVLNKSPADGVRFMNPKRISKTIGFTDEEVKRMLKQPDLHTRIGAMHYAILMVLFYCGLRRSELCDLHTKNLGTERNHRVIRLRGKGNSERVIVMVQAVWNAIQYYFYITGRTFAADEPLFIPLRNNRTGVVNKPLDPSTIFYIVTKYARQAGIANRVSPHSCRATAISNARDHNVPDRAIQEFAGWASPDMITRYDKRKSSIEHSAAHAIKYGADDRSPKSGPIQPTDQPSQPLHSDEVTMAPPQSELK